MLTSASGKFNSEGVEVNTQDSKWTWLISVKQNHVIWLTLNKGNIGKCLKIEVQ